MTAYGQRGWRMTRRNFVRALVLMIAAVLAGWRPKPVRAALPKKPEPSLYEGPMFNANVSPQFWRDYREARAAVAPRSLRRGKMGGHG